MSMTKRALDADNDRIRNENETAKTNCPDCRFDWDSRIWVECPKHEAESEREVWEYFAFGGEPE